MAESVKGPVKKGHEQDCHRGVSTGDLQKRRTEALILMVQNAVSSRRERLGKEHSSIGRAEENPSICTRNPLKIQHREEGAGPH